MEFATAESRAVVLASRVLCSSSAEIRILRPAAVEHLALTLGLRSFAAFFLLRFSALLDSTRGGRGEEPGIGGGGANKPVSPCGVPTMMVVVVVPVFCRCCLVGLDGEDPDPRPGEVGLTCRRLGEEGTAQQPRNACRPNKPARI
jgi:hypothetical protein